RIRRTFFQRRAGLATLHAAVGAGEGGCAAVDVSETDAVALAWSITPDWITPFIAQPPPRKNLRRKFSKSHETPAKPTETA
ncbi:hypothetical protein AB0J52_41600, partial [Spirillospora sp. NPDC049652]